MGRAKELLRAAIRTDERTNERANVAWQPQGGLQHIKAPGIPKPKSLGSPVSDLAPIPNTVPRQLLFHPHVYLVQGSLQALSTFVLTTRTTQHPLLLYPPDLLLHFLLYLLLHFLLHFLFYLLLHLQSRSDSGKFTHII